MPTKTSPGSPPDPPGHGRALRAAAAALLLSVLASGASCGPEPRLPPGTPAPAAPFVRLPYLQAVEEDRATVRWRVAGGDSSRLRWRPAGDTAWRRAAVRRGAGGERWSVLEGLEPSSTVEYRVTAAGVTPGAGRFSTAPTDTSSGPERVLAFGDSGWGSEEQVALAEGMLAEAREGAELAVHVGDVAYPDGTERDFTVRHFRVYAPMMARILLRPVPGNHDVRAEGGAAYDRAFGVRDGGSRRYWRLRWGRILFVGLDTSTDAVRDSIARRTGPQWTWLTRTLADAAADTTIAWTVALTHYPLYSRGAGLAAHGGAEELREALEPLFLRHGVDLVLAGHEHHYERSRPLRSGETGDPGCAPVHMITGGGGAARYGRAVEPGGYAARVSRSHHFVEFTFWPDHATGRAVAPDGRTIDRFRLVPYDPGRPACG